MTDSHDALRTRETLTARRLSWGGATRRARFQPDTMVNGLACPEREIVMNTRSGGIGIIGVIIIVVVILFLVGVIKI